ncbi:MAG: DUF1989 domain-containing protein [Pseudomonadota bacterium]
MNRSILGLYNDKTGTLGVMLDGLVRSIKDRRRYIGLDEKAVKTADVFCGQATSIKVKSGSLVSITNLNGSPGIFLTALDVTSKHFSPHAFDLPDAKTVSLTSINFDSRKMEEIALARSSTLEQGKAICIFDANSTVNEEFLLRVNADIEIFAVVPVVPTYLENGGGGHFRLQVSNMDGSDRDFFIPDPLGKVVDEWRVGTGTAKAYELKKGQFVQIIDVEGQQCSDFMAMRSDALDKGLERYIDSTVSRTMSRSAYPLPGLHDKFFDQDIRPLLAVRQDTVGRHDTFALACTARGYEERGFPGHINCSDNISTAYEPYSIASRKAWPAINFFFNSWIDWADHNIAADEAWSRPGDYVVMQALTDLVCVSTACPDDVDPINGWNPTDIHVRVYEEDSTISHSVAWRAQPEDSAQMTRHSAFHPRTSNLTQDFQVAKDLWLPSQFDATGAIAEYWACRNGATLQDMSSLLKYDVVGPDAEELLQACMTRNVTKLSQHRGFYALICDDRGSVIDDGTLFRLEPMAFRWCCGSTNSALHLQEQAEKLDLKAKILAHGHKTANLALQGPKSREILKEIVFTQPTRPSLENLKWFGFTVARLKDRDGPMFMLCRTGFTGELGYEIFCDEQDAVEIWDGVVAAGDKHGLKPMGSHALDMLRIEAGLMIAGAEFGPDADALESGLAFAVDLKKEDFIGKDALLRNSGAIRRKLVGLAFKGSEPPHHGDAVFLGREQVGVVTSGCFSPQLGHAIAMARIAIENAETGAELEVGKLDGHMKRLPCLVTNIPFIDAKREKPRA